MRETAGYLPEPSEVESSQRVLSVNEIGQKALVAAAGGAGLGGIAGEVGAAIGAAGAATIIVGLELKKRHEYSNRQQG